MSPPIPNDATAAENWPGPPLNTSFTNTGLNVRSGAHNTPVMLIVNAPGGETTVECVETEGCAAK